MCGVTIRLVVICFQISIFASLGTAAFETSEF